MNNQNLNTPNESKEEEIETTGEIQYTISKVELTVGNGFNFGIGFGLAIIVLGIIISILSLMGGFAFLGILSRTIKPF